jgi:hypothetical protein
MNTTTIEPINGTPVDSWTTIPPMTYPTRTAAPARPPMPARDTDNRSTTGNYSAGIDQVRYWVGAGITAGITALVGIIGLVVVHGIIHVPVALGSGHAVNSGLYGLILVALALGAAALFDGMLHVAPRPITYYSWLVAMVTALATLLPFTTTAGLHSQIAFGAMNLTTGLVIMILIPFAAVNARR